MTVKKTEGFEKKLARLEEIVGQLESGEAGLEDSLKFFEEGVVLSGELSAKLEEVRLKIEKLTLDAQNKAKIEPFEAASADDE